MPYGDGGALLRYHEQTNHSIERLRADTHRLDWANQPLPFKVYRGLESVPLPRTYEPSRMPALDALARQVDPSDLPGVPDLPMLGRLCHFSNGITHRLTRPGGEMTFRAAGTTGALYHVEEYLVCGDFPNLPAGVYHFAAHDNTLRRLRSGDFRQVVVEASGREPSIAFSPVILVCTSTYWRNAWKYRARAYRHAFWDTGTVVANLLAVAAANEVPARVVVGYADGPIEVLLGVDPNREGVVCLVALGQRGEPLPPAPRLEPLDTDAVPLSHHEVHYPAIAEAHAASSLASGTEAAAWRGERFDPLASESVGPEATLQPIADQDLPTEPIETIIRRRGSSRTFPRRAIGFGQLSTLLDRAFGGIPADCLGSQGWPLGAAYLIVNAVDGLDSGSYRFRPERRSLERLRAGDFRDVAGWLDLGQALGADAAVNFYFLADLARVAERLGGRGYRAAQLTCSISGGKLWLAAYALGLGATGLTFFDDDVIRFFSPPAAGQDVLFLLAIGRQ